MTCINFEISKFLHHFLIFATFLFLFGTCFPISFKTELKPRISVTVKSFQKGEQKGHFPKLEAKKAAFITKRGIFATNVVQR